MVGKSWVQHVSCLLFVISLSVSATDEGWFWHVTDFHYDFSYSGLDLSCNENVDDHGKYGNYWCDAPWKLVVSSVEAMKQFKPKVDFILWTGDSVLHARDENLSVDKNDEILKNITDTLRHEFENTSIYATYGNHDYHPNDQFPPSNNELYNRTFQHWQKWINEEEKDNFLRGGYYTTLTDHGLRIVALNTNLYYTSDKLTGSLDDPAGQFHWLDTLLAAAVTKNEKVLVTGHVPPGVVDTMGKSWMYPHFNTKMNNIIRRYSDVITGLHFGHEHIDNFRVFTKAGVPVVTMFLAPSVTPWRYKIPGQTGAAHNPAVRLVQYDRQTGQNLNMVTYYLDLPASNAHGNPVWAEEYNVTRDYSITDLSPMSMNKLIERMGVSESPEFDNYWKWRVVSVNDTMLDECDDTCKANIVCQFGHVDKSPYDACVLETVGGSTHLLPSLIVILLSAILCLATFFFRF